MKKYKLTDQDMKTYSGFQWELNKWVEVDGGGNLCTKHKLHYYHSPLLAVLLNPIHADIKNPRLFEVSCGKKGHINDRGLKGGCNKMKLAKEIQLPVITTTQKVAFAILLSLVYYNQKDYVSWAKNWLNTIDRSYAAAAYAALAATYTAALAAANAATYAAAYAADAAAYAPINFNNIAKKALRHT
jgi:hypothetical protein